MNVPQRSALLPYLRLFESNGAGSILVTDITRDLALMGWTATGGGKGELDVLVLVGEGGREREGACHDKQEELNSCQIFLSSFNFFFVC